jgi:hypothetical protein
VRDPSLRGETRGHARPGDAVPHFNVTDVRGAPAAYSAIWQHKILVLVTLPPAELDFARRYGAELTARLAAVQDAALVVTHEPVSGIPPRGLVVADRWGEVAHVSSVSSPAELPPAAEVVEWVDHVRHRCPECEGEAR